MVISVVVLPHCISCFLTWRFCTMRTTGGIFLQRVYWLLKQMETKTCLCFKDLYFVFNNWKMPDISVNSHSTYLSVIFLIMSIFTNIYPMWAIYLFYYFIYLSSLVLTWSRHSVVILYFLLLLTTPDSVWDNWNNTCTFWIHKLCHPWLVRVVLRIL